MVYGYARVSTQGQSLEEQIQALQAAGCTEIRSEKFTGTTVERPVFASLCAELKSGDTLVVTKLDRFARSVGQGAQLMNELVERGVTVNVLNMGVLSNDSVSTLMRNILLSFAQFERDMIVQRTSEGKAVARQKEGFHEGRPALSEYMIKQIRMGVGWDELGISRSTWYKYRQ